MFSLVGQKQVVDINGNIIITKKTNKLGWGTNYTYDEYISRKLFSSKYELEDYIGELEEDIDGYEKDLLAYAISDPKNIPDGDTDWSVVDAIRIKVKELLEYHNETIINLYKARNYLEVFDPNKIQNDAD